MNQPWLAYATEGSGPRHGVEAALGRVGAHYLELSREPLIRRGFVEERLGAVVWAEREPTCRWPSWARTRGVEVLTAYVPTGWERVVGDLPPEQAPIPLGCALAREPQRVGDLNAPFVIGVCDTHEERLTILNDALGAARLYELRFHGGVVWSNRLGALPIFAGIVPEADPRGWALLAAGGWFMGDSTPIRGARQVGPGTRISVGRSGISSTRTDTIERIVAPRRRDRATMKLAAEQARGLTRVAAELWREPPLIDLSGGRDSRIGAAAAVSEGVDAIFPTTDDLPGEVEIARELVAQAPRPMRHRVAKRRASVTRGTLRSRTLAAHLIEDGVKAPHGIRGVPRLPQSQRRSAHISGHGGGIAKRFFYGSEAAYRYVKGHGAAGPARAIERFCRRRHQAAREGAYELTRAEIETTLTTGRSYGLEGFALLDYFYLVDRFPHKSGVSMDPSTLSVFATPAFMRAAFDLSTRQRGKDSLHRDLIARLVPQWKSVPFHRRDRGVMPPMRRPRIWETSDAEEIDEMIQGGGSWTELFDPDLVRSLWVKARAGGGHAQSEQVFERIAWRAFYEEHLALLGKRAQEPPPTTARVGSGTAATHT